jgi:hypothetical protein
MKLSSIFGWYRILRMRHQFTVFEAMRCALWLAEPSNPTAQALSANRTAVRLSAVNRELTA